MYSDEDKLDEQQIEQLVRQIIKRTKGNINVDRYGGFYNDLQTIASDLGYIDKPKYTQSILSYKDTLNCVERVWKYVIEGVLAPGSALVGYNFFFPYLQLTERGKIVIEEW